MQFKKSQTIIIIFLALWIIFIGWGILKTTLQLSKQRTLLKEPSSQKPETSELMVGETPSMKAPDVIEPSPIRVRTFKVKRIDFSDILPVMGTVKGQTEIELRFEKEGVIKSINFREGERIKKGQLIACLDPKDANLQLEYVKNKLASADAAYKSSLKKYEVHQKLYEAGAIIKSKLEEMQLECESAKFQMETVRAEEELTKNQLEKTNLYAPIDGLMGSRDSEEGEFVTPQDKVASLLEIENVLVEVGIVERDINRIQLGQKAKVYVDAYPDVAFEGIIDNIFPVVEGKSRTLTTKIKIDNPKGALLPGMFCRADVMIIELRDALIIPSTSLIRTGKTTVLVPVVPEPSIEIDKDEVKTGRVELRHVSLGYITSDYTHITAGLNEGDLVVTEAQGELKDKAKVRISAIEELSL
jgi:membrane fusion protein (multidrug efflux system)